MLECVANISEGRDTELLRDLETACGDDLLDLHTDRDHHRSVFTMVGESAVRRLAQLAMELLDIRTHVDGVHPRLGIVDVVPFVPLFGASMHDALMARQSFAEWAARELGVPSFLYGDVHGSLTAPRTLPEIRKTAWTSLEPDVGPRAPHPRAGAICVGARQILVAYNIWMKDSGDGETVRRIASDMRSTAVRTLFLRVGDSFQVSMNLVDLESAGPEHVHSLARDLCSGTTATIEKCELVGLVPQWVLDRIEPDLWDILDLSPDRTIESRIRRNRAAM